MRSAENARACFEAGADAVGIAALAMEDAAYIHKMTEAFKAAYG